MLKLMRSFNKKSNEVSLANLAPEVLELILQHLNPKELAIMSLVSTLFNDLAKSDHIWQKKLQEINGDLSLNGQASYKELFYYQTRVYSEEFRKKYTANIRIALTGESKHRNSIKQAFLFNENAPSEISNERTVKIFNKPITIVLPFEINAAHAIFLCVDINDKTTYVDSDYLLYKKKSAFPDCDVVLLGIYDTVLPSPEQIKDFYDLASKLQIKDIEIVDKKDENAIYACFVKTATNYINQCIKYAKPMAVGLECSKLSPTESRESKEKEEPRCTMM